MDNGNSNMLMSICCLIKEHRKKDSRTQNIIMISLLRAVYEKLQLQHTHKEDAQVNQSTVFARIKGPSIISRGGEGGL